MKTRYTLYILLALLMGFPGHGRAQCDGGSCTVTINGTDDYGDGWNGGSITITQDGATVGTFSCSGSNSSATYAVCAGPISFSWTAGMYDEEVGFTIVDSLGAVLYAHTAGGVLGAGVFCDEVACASCSRPVALWASGITHDSATVGWRGDGGASAWLYQVGTAAAPSGSWISSSDTAVCLSGLSANTAYYFHVRKVCASSDTSSAATLAFRTACGDNPVPFYEGFEDNGNAAPFCWTVWEKGVYSNWGYVEVFPQIYNYSAHTGSRMLYMYDGYGPNSVITPRVLLPAGQVEATFWAYFSNYSGGSGSLQVGYTTTNDSATAVFHLVEEVALTSSYALYTVSFDTVSRTDSVYVCFRSAGNNTGMDGQTYLLVDDITVRRRNSCPTAASLRVAGTASQQMTLEWTDTVGTAWEVAYGPAGFDPDADTVRVAADSNPFTVTDLYDSVTYDFYVRTVCGEARGYWSQKATARPNVVDMPLSGTDTVRVCGASIADPGGVAAPAPSYTASTLVVYPDDSAYTVRLTGSVALGTGDHLSIYEGVGTSGRLLGQYSGNVAAVDVASDIGPVTILLSTSYNSYDGFLLTAHCEPLPTCTTPYGLQVSNVTGNSALVSWQYAGFTTPEYFTIKAVDTASGNLLLFYAPDTVRSHTITGLDQHTRYRLFLQASCDNGDTSQYVSSSFFTYCLSGGEALVGNENSTTTGYYVPSYFYGHAVSQQIIDSAELAGTDTIFGVRFYCTSTPDIVRNVDIYLDTTSRSAFGTFADFKVQSTATRRFSGPVHIANGWVEILFDSVYVYGGSGNLCLTYDDNTGTYVSSVYWKTTETTETKAAYGYSYYDNIDPTSTGSLGAISSYSQGVTTGRNTIVFLGGCDDAECVPPNVSVSSVTSQSVSLSWVPGFNETAWRVEYRHADSAGWNIHAAVTVADTARVQGLLPATAYRFRITSLCDDTAASAVIQATTACAPNTAIPFTEDFENFTASYNAPETQMCWRRHTNYHSSYGSSYYPYVDNYYSHSGSQSLYLYSENYGVPVNSMIVLPEMAPPADTLVLSFYMMGLYSTYYDYKAQVGVLTNPDDTASFVLVDTVRFALGDREWQYCEVSLDGYAGNGHYPAIRSVGGSGSFYVDDIRVEYFNPCRPPQGLRVFNATTDSVTLAFADANAAGSYTVVYGTADSLAGAADTVRAADTVVVLAGLSPGTLYHAWLRVDCAEGASKWVAFPPFRTLCDPLPVDAQQVYENNFEQGLDSCMSQESLVGSTLWAATSSFSSPAGAYSGGRVASLSNAGRSDQAMLILPAFDFTALDRGAEVTFWHAQDGGRLDVCYRTSPTGEWVAVDSFTTVVAAWTQRFVALPYSNNSDFYQVGFRAVASNYGVRIDDVEVHPAPTCVRPTDLAAGTVTNSTADLSWSGTAPRYQVRYRRVGAVSWSSRFSDSASITLTGLQGLSEYQCMVRACCSPTDNSNYSEPVAFFTAACASETARYNYDTSSYSAHVTALAPGHSDYMYTYSETVVDSASLAGMADIAGFAFRAASAGSTAYGSCEVYFGHTGSTAVDSFLFDSTFVRVYRGSLNFSRPGWKSVMLDTAFSYDGHSNLVVGVFRNNCRTSYDEVLFDGAVRGSNATLAACNYDAFTPATANGVPSYGMRRDSVVPLYKFFACVPACTPPQIVSAAAAETSVTVTWNADGGNAQVCHREHGSDMWSDPVDVVGSSHTFDGLSHSTAYDFRVRQDCGDPGMSQWAETTATTLYVCSVPSDLRMVGADNAHATFAWSSDAGDSRWEIRVFNNDFERHYVVDANPATVDGLTAGTAYHAAVRTLCGPEGDVPGDFSGSIDFSTPYCGGVSGATGEVIGNIAHLRWHAGNNASGFYEIQYGREGYGDGEALGSVIAPATEVYIYDLVPHFTYEFRVRSLCGLSWYSDWSDPAVVLTTGEAVGIEEAGVRLRCTLYPNPASGSATVVVVGAEGRVAIEVVDVNGRRVAGEVLECAADCSKQMDVSGLARGAYFVRIVTTQATVIRKLMVQ